MRQKRDGVFVWVTWLPKLMAGEQQCEWSPWLKANYEYYERVTDDFDAVAWKVEHTRLLRDLRIERQKAGNQIFIESQNKFKFKTPDGIVISGTPDMIELTKKGHGIIYDAKTGQKVQSHQIQVMIYMYLMPLARPEWAGTVFDGAIQVQLMMLLKITLTTSSRYWHLINHRLRHPVNQIAVSAMFTSKSAQRE